MKKHQVIAFVLLIGICFANFSPLSEKIVSGIQPNRKDAITNWTVMLYFCADTRDDVVIKNNKDNSGNYVNTYLKDALHEFRTILPPGSTENIKIICLFDHPYSSSDPNGKAVIYEIVPTMYPIEKISWGATNMGDETTLDNFISYCKTNYPATNYALVLGDHGRGYAGICFDYHAQHPYYNFLGDCLLPNEIGSAIDDNGGVDILLLDSCLGSSFEIAWDCLDSVEYFIASETTQNALALYHPLEFLWHLSRNTSMTDDEFAQCIFNAAINPSKVKKADYHWSCATLCNISAMNDEFTHPDVGTTNFRDLFIDFTNLICNELLNNLTTARKLFLDLRAQGQLHAQFSSNSMMVGLQEFFDVIADNPTNFTYTTLPEHAAVLRDCVTQGGDIILDHKGWGMNGFNLCFPSTADNCKGYMYPGQYGSYQISWDTKWDYFIYLLFDDPIYEIWPVPGRDYMYFFLDEIDPTANLHINFWFDPDDLPWHVGVNGGLPDSNSMDWEVGIEGAGYFEDFQGNTLIQIPMDNLPNSGYKNDEKILEVLVNGLNAASSNRPINLTVMHFFEGEVIWRENIVRPFECGELLRCEVSSENFITEFEVVDESRIPTKEPTNTNEIGFNSKLEVCSLLFLGNTLIFICTYIERKKRRSIVKI